MYDYEFAYIDFDGNAGSYRKRMNKRLSDEEVQEELGEIFRVFKDIKAATLTKIHIVN